MALNMPFATNQYTGQVIRQLGLSPGDVYTNKRKDIEAYQTAFGNSLSDPLYKSTAAKLGITDYNSVNDYAKVLDYLGNNQQQQAPVQAPTASNPQSGQTYTPTAAVADNFNPNGLQIKSPESDPMISQLQQMLIGSVKPPDTSQFTNQLSDIRSSVQNLPAQLANQSGLGQGVSLDSFSNIFQQQNASSPNQSLIPDINLATGLGQKLGSGPSKGQGGGLGGGLSSGSGAGGTNVSGGLGHKLGTGMTKTTFDDSIPNVQQGYNQELQGIQDSLQKLNNLQNQAGWRAKAAMQIGSESADSVQSASMSGASGTDKLNRKQSGNYLSNLTIKEPEKEGAAAPTAGLLTPKRNLNKPKRELSLSGRGYR